MIACRPMNARHRFAAFALVAFASGCAASGQAPVRDLVDEAIRSRTGSAFDRTKAAIRSHRTCLTDGLTPDEAVAIALWNSPSRSESFKDSTRIGASS